MPNLRQREVNGEQDALPTRSDAPYLAVAPMVILFYYAWIASSADAGQYVAVMFAFVNFVPS
jgi:hypothetical protein